jgi:uncharacterized membrane protein YqjE
VASTTNEGTTNEDTQPSIGSLVQEASKSFSTVLHGEIELAKLELTSSVKNAGAGAGFFAGAVVLVLFSLTFGLIALAEGIVALHIWRWAAYLIVFGFLLLLVAALAVLGIRSVKRVKAPRRTISTGKETIAALKRSNEPA